MRASPRQFLEGLFRTAVAAAQPVNCVPTYLPPAPRSGRLVILAAGKAGASMAAVAERHYLDSCAIAPARLSGLAVTRRGYGCATRLVRVVEAGHPVPDTAGLAATSETLALADAAGRDDLVLALISGGASANWIAPAAGLSLQEKQAVTRALLASGASIVEINTLRKHLSRIKGALAEAANETPKSGDRVFTNTSFALAVRPAEVFRAVERAVRAAGYESILLGTDIEGEAREVAAAQARRALELKTQGRRAVILSGGELTVTLHGKGRGGPNQEYALALAVTLAETIGVAALAADTDGTDGGAGLPDDPAGACIDASTLSRARRLGLDAASFLADNNSTEFFQKLGDLLVPGPTLTNVNDFRAILVDTD